MSPGNFQIVNADTDSISFCNTDGTPFSKEQQTELLDNLNSLFPSTIRFEHDGIFPKFLVIKAKNYVMTTPEGKVKYKGSAIKASTKEKALKEFIKTVIDLILHDKQHMIQDVYLGYATEAVNVKDMSRWVTRKTLTDKVFKNERTNERKVRDAVAGKDYQEGDRVYLYFKPGGSLGLLEDFQEDHDPEVLLRKLHDTGKLFSTILDTKALFPNLSLKKNRAMVEELIGRQTP